MKLFELDAPKSVNNASIMEKHFGKNVDFDSVSVNEAKTMLSKVSKIIHEHRQTPDFHHSEKNPAYLKLLIIEQSLQNKISEQDSAIPIDMDDPATKATLDKLERNQSLSPDEQKIANAIAASADDEGQIGESTHGVSDKFAQKLTESDIEQAQVVLASKDLVDRIQKMIEDVSEVQYKELPALVDQTRSDLGTSEAETMQKHMGPALEELMQSLQQTKEKMNTGLAVLTGEDVLSVPGEDDIDMEVEPEDDIDDIDLEPELDADLGRPRR